MSYHAVSETKRDGTVSLMAGLDLSSGHVFGIVRNRHHSCEFIELREEFMPTSQKRGKFVCFWMTIPHRSPKKRMLGLLDTLTDSSWSSPQQTIRGSTSWRPCSMR